MKFRSSLCALLFVILGSTLAFAQESDLKTRVELAQKIVQLLPAAPQIESAVNRYVELNLAQYNDKERDIVRRAMLGLINPKALDKATLDAYAETYTAPELRAMIEYYSKPEAQSAQAKQEEFATKLTPEIIKILDQAVIDLRVAAKPAPH